MRMQGAAAAGCGRPHEFDVEEEEEPNLEQNTQQDNRKQLRKADLSDSSYSLEETTTEDSISSSEKEFINADNNGKFRYFKHKDGDSPEEVLVCLSSRHLSAIAGAETNDVILDIIANPPFSVQSQTK